MNPYFPYVLMNYKECEVDVVICPKETADFYMRLLDNNNSKIFELNFTENVIKQDFINRSKILSTNNLSNPTTQDLHKNLSSEIKKQLASLVIEITESDEIWEKRFWIDFSKLKTMISNANAIFDIYKTTNRFYFRHNLSGICSVTQNYQSKFIFDDFSFSSINDAIDFLGKIYFDFH